MGPHHVVALVAEGTVLLDLAIPAHVFGYHGEDRYRFSMAGLSRGRVCTVEGIALELTEDLRALDRADTIVVPGYSNVLCPPASTVLDSLRAAASRGARVMSICTGAFTLAYAGLLDGRRATTHWAQANLLAELFPRVTVDANRLYIDDGDILTSAGVAAGLDLCLHVLRRDHGASVAASIARHTVVAPHRSGGQAQYVEAPVVSLDNGEALSTTLAWALSHLHERLDLARLARHARMSPRTLSRRFKAETGTTPVQWLLGQRLLRARQMLEQSDSSVEQIARSCGFHDAASLRKHFIRSAGTTPSAYRRAFSTRSAGRTANG